MQPKDLKWNEIVPYNGFSFVDKQGQFEQDPKKFMTSTPLRLDGQSVKVTLKGEVVTDGINVASFDKNVHSLGLALSDHEDLEILKDQADVFAHVFTSFPDDWEVKDLIKGDVLYLKLKTKDGQYRFKTDIKMDPENPKKCNLTRKDVVEVKAEMQAYINFKDKFGGFFLDVLEIKTKAAPVIKRRKKDD
jgi:hypothetical protein